jgi:hypothetical protein
MGLAPMLSFAAALTLAFTSPESIEVKARALKFELARFPSFEVADHWCRFGTAHQEWAYSQKVKLPLCGCFRRWFGEAEKLTIQWGWLRRAQNPRISMDDRLAALERLEELLGSEDWLLGRMPLPPLHDFQEGPPPESIWEDYEKNIAPVRPMIPTVTTALKLGWMTQCGHRDVGKLGLIMAGKLERLIPYTKEQIAAWMFVRKGMTERQVTGLIGQSSGCFSDGGGTAFLASYPKARISIWFSKGKVESWQ